MKEDANVIILMENRIVKHQNIEFEWFLKARKIFTNKVKRIFLLFNEDSLCTKLNGII